jgi:tetratricopeptide (TPR) repeat protein
MSAGRPDLQRFLFHLFKELGSGALERPTRENMERGLGLLLDAAALPADDAQKAEVHMNIASIYRALADSLGAERRPEMLEKSATYFGKVLEAYPEDPDALADLAYVYSDMGQHEQALQIGQQRVDLEPWAREPRLMMYRLYRAGKNDKDANGQFLVAQILQDGTPQPREGVRARVTQEFGPTSEMLKVLRDRGEPEEIRTYESGTAPFHMWAYWTGGRVYIFQNGIEKFRLAFKAVPREKLSEILQR